MFAHLLINTIRRRVCCYQGQGQHLPRSPLLLNASTSSAKSPPNSAPPPPPLAVGITGKEEELENNQIEPPSKTLNRRHIYPCQESKPTVLPAYIKGHTNYTPLPVLG